MFGLPTPASTQVTQDTGPDPIQDTQVTRHTTYYNADVPDPIILQVRRGSCSLIAMPTNFNGVQVENISKTGATLEVFKVAKSHKGRKRSRPF